MSSAREAVLARLRKRAQGGDDPGARLQRREPGPIPARTRVGGERRIGLFVEMAEKAAASVTRVEASGEVPTAVTAYLARHESQGTVALAPDEAVRGLPWQDTGLEVHVGPAEPDDVASVTPVFAGIAETGTLMTVSGAHHPTTLNLLPESHIAVLRADRIVGSYEEAWQLLRQESGKELMPRTVLWITGPSRSADIEQTLLMGAHGPRRLHIVLVG